jgi:hypothetical protein
VASGRCRHWCSAASSSTSARARPSRSAAPRSTAWCCRRGPAAAESRKRCVKLAARVLRSSTAAATRRCQCEWCTLVRHTVIVHRLRRCRVQTPGSLTGSAVSISQVRSKCRHLLRGACARACTAHLGRGCGQHCCSQGGYLRTRSNTGADGGAAQEGFQVDNAAGTLTPPRDAGSGSPAAAARSARRRSTMGRA